MIKRPAALAAGLVLAVSQPTFAQDMSAPAYPETRRGAVVEEQFGEAIADPYRWLENDVRTDPEVASWVEAQNAFTEAYLERLPARGWFRQRIAELYDYARSSTPYRAGEWYFYTRNTGLQNQSPLYARRGLAGEERLLLDPNGWAKDAATALSGWAPSPDGSKLLYSVQDAGSDWRILKVLDVAIGEQRGDEIRWAKYTDLAWVGEEGFLYSRFAEPAKGQDFQALTFNQEIYFHRLGTPQSEDELVYSTPGDPELGHSAAVTDDGRWAIITTAKGTDARYEVRAIDLLARATKGWQARVLVSGLEDSWSAIESRGGRIWFKTNKDAPLYRVLAIDLDAADPRWTEIVPESDRPIESAALLGDRLVLSYLKDASSQALLYTLDGKPAGEIALPGIGSLGGFSGHPGDNEAFYSFASYNRPTTVFRLDVASGASSVHFQPELKFAPDDFLVEQRFYASKDGTRVPMFIVRKRSAAEAGKPAPTLLYGYGGFNQSMTPSFSSSRLAWMEAGGVYAVANIRGGGEYGRAWHDAGRLARKQNAFDDFIAAGEFLKSEGIASKDGLAIQGGSNGGTLVGAVVNQRPDLFAAANAQVGVMDMLRFDRFTAGRYWVDDYGYPSKEADFRVLRAYSPYHNIQPGVEYPAMLVTTADTDDRVVPGHSFKYTAALQAAGVGDRPQLIRIETRAGHGSGKPTDKAIEEAADTLAFLAYWAGLAAPAEEAN